jgi:hypothetical protein
MKNIYSFQPGTYYIGDPGFVLPNEDLRMLFAQLMHGNMKSGPRELIASTRSEGNSMMRDTYWLAVTPHKAGTLYDQDGKGWGFDWGGFGIVPWKWVKPLGSYDSNKIEFTDPFECFSDTYGITIGYYRFTYTP